MRWLLLCTLVLLGCYGGENPTDMAPREPEFDSFDAGPPSRAMPPVYPSVDPCEVVKEYMVMGKLVRIPTWCDPEPFIYKGYPSPERKP